jgi:hypothetical protein
LQPFFNVVPDAVYVRTLLIKPGNTYFELLDGFFWQLKGCRVSENNPRKKNPF